MSRMRGGRSLLIIAMAAAALAAPAPAGAQVECESAAGLRFICGLINAEDLIEVPGSPWIIASGLAEGENSGGHIYAVNAHDYAVEVLLPGHVAYGRPTASFGGCPGPPEEGKFSAHGLSLRRGSASEHTLYVVHHGERESVEVFRLTARPATAPTLTWVGCVLYPAGVFGNGIAVLPGEAFAASNFMSTNDPKAADKLAAGEPEGGMLIWRPQTGWQDVPDAASISADNGVEVSTDGTKLFVAGWGDGTLARLSLDRTPKELTIIKTGFHTDNLRWGPDGFLYAAGQRDSVANLWACAPGKIGRAHV